MAKLKKIVPCVIRNNEGQEISANTMQTPRRSEPGVKFGMLLNHKGASFLQANGHPEVVNNETYMNYLVEKTGIPLDCFGKLTDWNTPEAREVIKVTLDGEVWAPELKSDKITGEETVESQQPEVVETQVQAQPPMTSPQPAVADTTRHNVNAIVTALKEGYNEELIKQKAVEKFGEEEAEKLINQAKEALKAPQTPTPTPPPLQQQQSQSQPAMTFEQQPKTVQNPAPTVETASFNF